MRQNTGSQFKKVHSSVLDFNDVWTYLNDDDCMPVWQHLRRKSSVWEFSTEPEKDWGNEVI